MISASKTTFSHYNLKIFRPKVTKNLTNLPQKFVTFDPRHTLILNLVTGTNIEVSHSTFCIVVNEETLVATQKRVGEIDP